LYSNGSVKVDFHLDHSYYLDQAFPGYEALKLAMENELKQGKLGVFRASMDSFVFVPVEPDGEWYLVSYVSNLYSNTVLSTCGNDEIN
jgi:hypothetical protein